MDLVLPNFPARSQDCYVNPNFKFFFKILKILSDQVKHLGGSGLGTCDGVGRRAQRNPSAFGFIGSGSGRGAVGRGLSVVSVQCPLQEMVLQQPTVDLLPKLRAMALADRAVFEKGVRAFVSHIQAYAKHECSLIFRLKGKSGLCTGVLVGSRYRECEAAPSYGNVRPVSGLLCSTFDGKSPGV